MPTDSAWRQRAAKQVRELTGFSIGGIPPIGHDRALPEANVTDVSKPAGRS